MEIAAHSAHVAIKIHKMLYYRTTATRTIDRERERDNKKGRVSAWVKLSPRWDRSFSIQCLTSVYFRARDLLTRKLIQYTQQASGVLVSNEKILELNTASCSSIIQINRQTLHATLCTLNFLFIAKAIAPTSKTGAQARKKFKYGVYSGL